MKGEDTYEEEALTLTPGQWQVHAPTGVVSLKEEAFQAFVNAKPIESIYVLDPEPIARGQFAVVYHCTHRITGREYAAKFSSRVRMGSDCSPDLVHEIAVSAMLGPTPRAVHLVDVFSTDGQLVLVMEYAPGGDLQTLLDENLVPYENDVIKFMRQLLEGLAFIHDKNIVHLDIKPQNLVLMGEFPNCAVKLCDFEISRMLTPGHQIREILGTPDYVAPEILHYEPITTRTDMWSVGVLTYVLLTGFLPFGGDNDQETFVEILKGEVDFPPELFDDITPEAIDFIKKLLLKQPEQRMSAKECLNHKWMKKGSERPTPPSTLDLTSSLNSQMSSTPAITVVSSVTSPAETTSKPVVSHPVLQKSPSESSHLQDFATPSKDIGRPPLHPSSSQKSLFSESVSVAGTPVTTPGTALSSPFIYPRQESRFGSRHNLDRLRSMSKSREVLSERVQMSNIKKCMSKSRERLNDAKLGMSKSREKLMALSSLSQSVEVLSALSHLTQQNNVYQSCNNIFVPKLNLPSSVGNSPGRMYQSMAAIDQIDNMNNLKKMGYFESRISLNGDDYNDILTQRNTDMNSFIGDLKFDNRSPSGLRGNSCKGGRGDDTCDNRCTRHRQQEAKQTQKLSKMSRTEKLKKEAQRRRKEKREKEKREHLKKQRERQKTAQATEGEAQKSKITSDGSSSPSFRRGSVSHVEQRIQERHERNQERLEKQEREEKTRRRLSVDQEKSSTIERSKRRSSATLDVSDQRSRSSTPTRRKSRRESPLGSDASQTSSMESVHATTERTTSTELAHASTEKSLRMESEEKLEENNNIMNESIKADEGIEADEAYVSLEDPSLENLSRSKSTESASSDESDKTVVENTNKDTCSSSEDELGLETLSVSEKIFGFEKGIFVELKKAAPLMKQKSISEMIEKGLESKELPVITEEGSGSSPSLSLTPPDFQRSISNTSDFGSLISEASESSIDKEMPQLSSSSSTINETLCPEWKSRSRSHSVYSSPSPPLSSPRSRSNSFNFDVTDSSVARPWGTVCSGSVARAFEKFNLKSTESPKRRSPSPAVSPSEEDFQSSKLS